VRGSELVICMHWLAEGHLRCCTRGMRPRGIELMPLRRWKFLKHRLELCSYGRRHDGFGQNAKSRAMPLLNWADGPLPVGLKRIPIRRQAEMNNLARAIGIVEIH